MLTGCAPAAGPPAPPRLSTSPAAHRVAAQQTLDALTEAVTHTDLRAFGTLVSDADPAFATTAAMLWNNLQQLSLGSLELTAGAREAPLPVSRRAQLGETAWAQQVRVRWRLPEEQLPAEHQVWISFVLANNGALVAGTSDVPARDSRGQPLWWLEPVTAARTAGSVAVVGSGGAATDWAARAEVAASQVAARLPRSLAAGWDRRLVVEVPASRRSFERVLGVAAGSYRRIAAVAWAEGPTPKTAAVRIVVDPEAVSSLAGEGLAILLTHEATHVATRSPGSAAPTWLVEGLADYVAYQAYPDTRDAAAATVLAEVSRHGPPRALPDDAAFTPTAAQLDHSYAQAWLACRFAAETYSAPRLAELYRQANSGSTVAEAIRSAFGVDEEQFTAAWRRYLVTLSGQR
ncbi:MAG: hypothetical protein JWN06_1999 [Propionibacteriaceae bacterium]|jgi:hypothetical protein|nr:hypothetical protein [Propionibacteriaceae bacterium]